MSLFHPPATVSPIVLALETSCDETAVAILRGRSGILASEVASQVAAHRPFGGVVPELASRAHLRRVGPCLEQALVRAGVGLGDVAALAATRGPGLASSLLVGSCVARGLALALARPFHAINHLEGHLLSPFFGRDLRPGIALIASGGHTLLLEIAGFGRYRILGRTRDDAAGEAFDKVARLVGLDYPGGPEVERHALGGDPARYSLPRGMPAEDDFSFSGLKTAVRVLVPKLRGDWLADLCASFQEAVVDALVSKTVRVAVRLGHAEVSASGGVSLNTRLRQRLAEECARAGINLLLASPDLTTDNAAMIAQVAAERVERGWAGDDLGTDIDPNLRLEE